MHTQGQNLGNDSDSLQTDVMRFMAIIAFCLIAILALAKDVEPTDTTIASAPPTIPVPVETTEVADHEPSPWQPVVEDIPDPVQLPVSSSARSPAPSVTEPSEQPIIADVIDTPAPDAPAPKTPATKTPATKTQGPERQSAAAPETDSAPPASGKTPAVRKPPAQKEAPAPEEKESLILRFASDGDFLRLIAKGDIKVYAFQESDVLTLNPSYRFLDTKSPGQVYELSRPSIPGLIVDALKQERQDIEGFRWGIALPGHISNQIERHLSQVTGGQLVINRYGDVRHVAAS